MLPTGSAKLEKVNYAWSHLSRFLSTKLSWRNVPGKPTQAKPFLIIAAFDDGVALGWVPQKSLFKVEEK